MSEHNTEEKKAEAGDNTASSATTSWSWGAFMFDAPFLIATRKYKYLWFYLLLLVPILNFFAIAAIKIYLGIKGAEIARTSSTFDSEAEYNGFMKGFDWAGKVSFFIGLAIFALGLIGVFAGAFAFSEMFTTMSPADFGVEGIPGQ